MHFYSLGSPTHVASMLLVAGLLLTGCVADKAVDDMDMATTDVADTSTDADLGMRCTTVDDTQTCMCDDGAFGTQSCQVSGEWGVCDCAVPIDCEVSAWGDYDACTAACGGGMQTRTRTVVRESANGGMECPELSESQTCNTQPCATCTDGMQNGDEEGIDCGGTCELGCPGHTVLNVDVAGRGASSVRLYESDVVDVQLDVRVGTPGCPGCRTQLYFLTETGSAPDQWVPRIGNCIYDGVPGDTPEEQSHTLIVPGAWQDTEVRLVQTFESDCNAASQLLAPPGPPRGEVIATIEHAFIPSVTLQHQATGNCIDLFGASTITGEPFVLGGCTGNQNQAFAGLSQSQGSFKMIIQHSTLCPEIRNGSIADGAPLVQEVCQTRDSQRFQLIARDGGYQINALHSQKCLQPNGAMMLDDYIEQRDCAGPGNAAGQLFTISPDP